MVHGALSQSSTASGEGQRDQACACRFCPELLRFGETIILFIHEAWR